VDRSSTDPSPSVTVVVPTRDRPQLLRRAVAAILGQSYQGPIECLVVFDQSEPALDWGELPAGRSLQVITNQRTPGLAGARNSGALAGTGELVAFCDDDDEWLPDKLSRQVEALAAHPDLAVATCGIVVRYGRRAVPRVSPDPIVGHRRLLRDRVTELHPSTVLVRRAELLDGIGLVDEAIPGSYAEDYEWLLRAARLAPILAVQEALVRVYWHRSSWFSDRWQTIAAANRYLTEKHPEFHEEPRGLAKLYGKIAFAEAASGERGNARRWARRSLGLNRGEPRAWLALAVSLRLLGARTVVRALNLAGRGI
jgi:glycosyltransferase involved in cell wall biosynthesis